MIGCSLSMLLSSVKHILQDVNRKAQNRTCKQPLKAVIQYNVVETFVRETSLTQALKSIKVSEILKSKSILRSSPIS